MRLSCHLILAWILVSFFLIYWARSLGSGWDEKYSKPRIKFEITDFDESV